MRGLLLLFALHGTDDHPGGDRWFSADKAKHFFAAAFVQSVSFSALRAVGASHGASLAGATFLSAGVSVGKELRDRKTGGDPSLKDLAWDAAGIVAASALLGHTR
ncbi:MAG TPA: hypothetical protein VN706_20125 [Gemmatimonadaceae bacterium]|jgi:uncharacterized protein YfiM (DUF2279 family)|nr:hypothetical protein [Gemmatimonadaceae bacterium]